MRPLTSGILRAAALTMALAIAGFGQAKPVQLEWKDLIPTEAQASQEAQAEAAAFVRAREAEMGARYERELMNPREALSLGSISRMVMPSELRQVLGLNLALLMRTYTPSPFQGVQREFH